LFFASGKNRSGGMKQSGIAPFHPVRKRPHRKVVVLQLVNSGGLQLTD
jgi:hypothetical protein